MKSTIRPIIWPFKVGGEIRKALNHETNSVITFLVLYGRIKTVSACWVQILELLNKKAIKYNVKEYQQIPSENIKNYIPAFRTKKTVDILQKKNADGSSATSGIEDSCNSDLDFEYEEKTGESFTSAFKTQLKSMEKADVAKGVLNLVSNKIFG